MKKTTALFCASIVTAMLNSGQTLAEKRHLHSHEHGVSALKISQEGNVISMELEAPANDIVGFEHEAENDQQRASVKAALAVLSAPEKIFVLPSGAGCVASDQHADFEADGDHAEFHVTWKLTCATVANAKALSIGFFDAFKNAEEIELEAIGDAGQAAIEVEKTDTSVDISKAIGG